MKQSIGILLCALAIAFVGCAKNDAPATDDDGSGDGEGGSQQPAKGGSGPAMHTGGTVGSGGSSSGGSGGSTPAGDGGSSASGGTTATGGSSASGGSGEGGDIGGGSGGSSSGGTSGGDDAGTPGGADASTGNPNNPCFTTNISNNRSLPGLSAADFCDGYEKYCKYTPDGSLMSKCGPGQPVGPLYKDRMDCMTKYMAASAGARACRAGQMCRNGKDGLAMGADTAKGASLIVNACSHATGYCAGACK
jgi:hypothetical protein